MVMANAHKKVLSTLDVAKLMGVQTATIRRFAIAGELDGTKLSGGWVFDVDDVARFIRRRDGDIDPGRGGRPRSGGPK